MMLATKKPLLSWRTSLAPGLIFVVLVAGCSPPGPRALLKGEKLIQQGKYADAIEELRLATELLPRNAQAWNHLGLAYHGAGHVTNAITAYRKALLLDRDLMAAHYNLGSLWIEQNNLPAALEELTIYVSHPRYAKSAEGWTRLGTAYLRARRWDEAEKAFSYALKHLEVRSPEVLNDLGVIQAQRRRTTDAVAYFNSALSQQRDYGPALLNLANLYQQQTANRQLALQKYREYLALSPRPTNWEAVQALAQQLDADLNPPLLRPVASNTLVQMVPKTNPVPSVPTNLHARTTVSNALAQLTPKTNPVLSVPTNLHARTAVSSAPPTVVASLKPNIVPPTLPPRTTTLATPPNTNLPPPVRSTATQMVSVPVPVSNKPSDIEVTQISEGLIIKPAQDLVAPAPISLNVMNPPLSAQKAVEEPNSKPPPKESKRSILDRLNPFGGKSKKKAPEAPPPVTPIPAPPKPATDSLPTNPPVLMATAVKAVPLPAPPVPRYTYLSPAKPAAGHHAEAERFFQDGIKAQQAGQTSPSQASYQKATELDPAYFEAHFNLGVAAYAAGNWKQSITANEFALALKPDSTDARYNLALALRQAGFWLDAADELNRILNAHPDEVRAHLSLGNLCAQQLNQPQLAREHYLKLLATDPRHPQAAQIRYWLAAHP